MTGFVDGNCTLRDVRDQVDGLRSTTVVVVMQLEEMQDLVGDMAGGEGGRRVDRTINLAESRPGEQVSSSGNTRAEVRRVEGNIEYNNMSGDRAVERS